MIRQLDDAAARLGYPSRSALIEALINAGCLTTSEDAKCLAAVTDIGTCTFVCPELLSRDAALASLAEVDTIATPLVRLALDEQGLVAQLVERGIETPLAETTARDLFAGMIVRELAVIHGTGRIARM